VIALKAGSATDVGLARQINEDRLHAGPRVFVVADGMGGHAGGEIAAELAVEQIVSMLEIPGTPVDARQLAQAVHLANHVIWATAEEQPELRGMGTTLVAALITDPPSQGHLALAHIGDSRVYLERSGRLLQLTNDHSVAQEMVRQGTLTPQAAASHPKRHMLTRALGVGPTAQVDVAELELIDGDRVLLCSDGLTNELGDEEISKILQSNADPQMAADQLVSSAVRAGGRDNVTVVVIDAVDDSNLVSLGDQAPPTLEIPAREA